MELIAKIRKTPKILTNNGVNDLNQSKHHVYTFRAINTCFIYGGGGWVGWMPSHHHLMPLGKIFSRESFTHSPEFLVPHQCLYFLVGLNASVIL